MNRVTEAFLDLCDDEGSTPERVLMQIVSAAHSLRHLAQKDWPDVIEFTLRMAEPLLPDAVVDFSDGYHLAQIMEAQNDPQSSAIRKSILRALNIKITASNYEVISQSGDFTSYQKLWERWQSTRSQLRPKLKSWIREQLKVLYFPFSNSILTLPEQATCLAVQFATLRLALMCSSSPEQEISRFINFPVDEERALLAYKELGWHSLPRLRGLVMDI